MPGREVVQSMTALPTPVGYSQGQDATCMVGPSIPPLKLGDCMVYGVAKAEREPLLFKGPHLSSGDFSQTDVEPALKD
jgi:uncharacterized protein with PIN domain